MRISICSNRSGPGRPLALSVYSEVPSGVMWMGYGGAWQDDAPVEVVVGHSHAPPGTEETALRTRRLPRVQYDDHTDSFDRDKELVRPGELDCSQGESFSMSPST